MGVTKTDCRTETGITVGLIDAFITLARVLRKRGDIHLSGDPDIFEAVKDMQSDEDVAWVVLRLTAKQMESYRLAFNINNGTINLENKNK